MALIALTETPIDLIADEGLTAGTTYTVKAELRVVGGAHGSGVSAGPYVRLNDSGASAPTNNKDGYPLSHLQEAIMESGSDSTLWAWVESGKAVIQVFESV